MCSNILCSPLQGGIFVKYATCSNYAFQCILNLLLEHIEQFNTAQCIFISTDCSIREYRSDFSPLCWHNMHAYYALNYVGIFVGGLVIVR